MRKLREKIVKGKRVITPQLALAYYYCLGADRSLDRVAEWMRGQEGVDKGTKKRDGCRKRVEKWSVEFDWQAKIAQWTAEAEEAMKVRMIKRQALTADKIELAVTTALVAFIDRFLYGKPVTDAFGQVVYREDGMPLMAFPSMSLTDLKAGLQMLQLFRGEATDIIGAKLGDLKSKYGLSDDDLKPENANRTLKRLDATIFGGEDKGKATPSGTPQDDTSKAVER